MPDPKVTIAHPGLWQGDTEHVPLAARLAKIEPLTPTEKYFAVKFDRPAPLDYRPGQFVQVWVPRVGEAPISISSAPDGSDFIELAVRRIGNVTQALHEMHEGDAIGIRGPYGHGFPIEQIKGNDLLLVAGGIGYAPLRSLLKYVLKHRADFGSVRLIYGARSPKDFLFYDELLRIGHGGEMCVRLTIDKASEGWPGHVGVVTTLMTDLKMQTQRTYVVVCGPPVMYKFVIISLAGYHLPEDRILLSLERRMECGVGKCGHCQINSQYVCKAGPVFDYKSIKHLPEAFTTI